MLNFQKGNMYGFVSHTWNGIKGLCPHNCSYCYVKAWGNLREIRLDEKEFKTDLGSGNYIFVGSSCDMFAARIPNAWILKVLEHCRKYPENRYLFQSKNPARFTPYLAMFPDHTTLCTTIETNRPGFNYNAPPVEERVQGMMQDVFKRMVTIEPIMDFDLDILVKMIKEIKPFQVNIGADSKGHNLPEPSAEKVQALIKELEGFTAVVHQKSNLRRIWRTK